ncbi:hypothetical protein [Flavobacterium cerinum]|uniref:Lipoprotein n=1 Tax=Flavobacterium cerinum TaxID=2502784 RepID=A0ABY5IQV7_9FLAO|nr:hypothetical protein [Flavobacterium cerinum]UUC45203.1 hypothetical protein NOX80_16455 [Flavobacterium cerinum]
MKNIIFTLAVILFISCKPLNNNQEQVGEYKVYKIDTIDSFYTIYCEKNGEKYKIVSKEQNEKVINSNEKIAVGQSYNFVLNLYRPNNDSNPLTNATTAPNVIRCYMFENTKICEEEGIKLYTSNNLKGLSFIKS